MAIRRDGWMRDEFKERVALPLARKLRRRRWRIVLPVVVELDQMEKTNDYLKVIYAPHLIELMNTASIYARRVLKKRGVKR
jgi:hypothetical protein